MKHIHLDFRIANRNVLFHDGPLWEGTKKGKTKFILLAHFRTGSTLLGELLKCHPAIQFDGEVFGRKPIPQKILFPSTFLEERVRASHAHAYGVDLKPSQIHMKLIKKMYDPKVYLQKLHRKGWKFINLKRRNVLRQALSIIIANQRQEWHSWTENLEEHKKFRIDPTQLLHATEWMEQSSNMENDLLHQIPHATLWYEEDLLRPEQHQPTANRVFNFLSLPPATVHARMLRLSTDDLGVFIENYSELQDALGHTKYAKFLEE